MDENTKALLDRLEDQRIASKDCDHETDESMALSDAINLIARQARDIVELKDEEASAESGLIACYEAAGLSGDISWARLVEAIQSQAKELEALRSASSIESGLRACYDAAGIADDRSLSWSTLVLEINSLRESAARYQLIKSKTKVFSLDMGGNHTYVIDFAIARLRGPNFDAAVDAAIAAKEAT